ncbi:MAG: dual specificity protein phosphatase [Actinomycetota bacterium]
MRDLETPVEQWHRTLCKVTEWLYLCGDLPSDQHLAKQMLDQWIAEDITAIIDVREEWSDEALVAERAPGIEYFHFGTHDNGGTQSAEWFEQGLSALHQALKQREAKVVVHCHMGINRGPSMGFAFLLDQGWQPVEALDAIRTARPIAAVAYAKDALLAHHARRDVGQASTSSDLHELEVWMRENNIDVRTVIRRIRQSS